MVEKFTKNGNVFDKLIVDSSKESKHKYSDPSDESRHPKRYSPTEGLNFSRGWVASVDHLNHMSKV